MRNSRGAVFGIGSRVQFQYPVDGRVNVGVVKSIDGAYVMIEFEIDGGKYLAERYPEEVLAVLPAG